MSSNYLSDEMQSYICTNFLQNEFSNMISKHMYEEKLSHMVKIWFSSLETLNPENLKSSPCQIPTQSWAEVEFVHPVSAGGSVKFLPAV